MNRRTLTIAATASIAAVAVSFLGCVHQSGGEWMVRSAPLPEGWPELTPVGEIQVKQYPTYRAATVTGSEVRGSGQSPMFMELFRHIKRRDIAMTAPVDMTYTNPDQGQPKMASMAFLYRTPELGPAGTDDESRDGSVVVVDLPPTTYATLGVRGDYTVSAYTEGLQTLESWMAQQADWTADGPPRFLGYNGPFVPTAMRYGEVQIPVRPASPFDGLDIREPDQPDDAPEPESNDTTDPASDPADEELETL